MAKLNFTLRGIIPPMKNEPKNLFLHADGDAFFVGCELSVHPELRGKPVIVGGDRGIAVAMSPEAKSLGVTRGMPVFRIKKLFPEVIILSHHFDLYREVRDKMHQILLSYFEKIEVYSIDECFALVEPHIVKYFGSEKKLITEVKNEVNKTLHVSYSFGLARTKALSKLASKLEKPSGLVILLTQEDEIRALRQTPIDNIWGIGRSTVPRLAHMGCKTAYDFVKLEKHKLKNFSTTITTLQRELQGEEILNVESDVDPRDQKSIQSTATFHPSSTDPIVILREISENVEEVSRNSRALGLVSNKISFFVKTSEFKYHFGEIKLEEYTSDPGAIFHAIENKFYKVLPKRTRIRSTGVILHNLTREEKVPRDLFGRQEKLLKNMAIELAADKLREKYGKNTIKRLSSLKGGNNKDRN